MDTGKRLSEGKGLSVSDYDGLTLQRVKPGVYAASGGEIFRLVPVDRLYPGKKAPRYYLQRIENGKAQYISGVFETDRRDLLSMDIRDDLGVKIYYNIVVQAGGEILLIKRREKGASRRRSGGGWGG